jgi:hypothetical protein
MTEGVVFPRPAYAAIQNGPRLKADPPDFLLT